MSSPTPAEKAAAEKRELEKIVAAEHVLENISTAPLLRFADLKRLGIVQNWVTLSDWIRKQGFPPGFLLGPNTRAWDRDSVLEWVASRPTARGE